MPPTTATTIPDHVSGLKEVDAIRAWRERKPDNFNAFMIGVIVGALAVACFFLFSI